MFLASAFNYQQHDNPHGFHSTLNVPQYTYARHTLCTQPSSSSSSSVPSSSVTTAAIKQETDPDLKGPSDGNSNIKFSIDNILGLKDSPDVKHEETTEEPNEDYTTENQETDSPRFPWLQCTRYKPPKLPRLKKKDGVKRRKLGRNPRVPFTQHQVAVLEEKFRRTHYLSSMDVAELSTALNLSDNRVKIWFQNRRARERRDREAVQTTSMFPSKQPQPLLVPSVTWPVPPHTAGSAFAQLRTAIQQSRGGFVPSAFSLYIPRPCGQDGGNCNMESPGERDAEKH